MGYLQDFRYKCKLKINSNYIDEDLTYFPLTLFVNYDDFFDKMKYNLNDDFSGNDGSLPNIDKWSIVKSSNGSIYISSNMLHEVINTSVYTEYTRLKSNFVFKDDLDLYVDFNNLNLGDEHDDVGCEIKLYPLSGDSSNQAYIKAGFYSSYGSGCFRSRITINGTYYDDYLARSNNYGKLRIVKQGSTLTTYIIDGNGSVWTEVGSKSGFYNTEYVVLLGIYKPANNTTISVNFDNFTIASGIEYWPSPNGSNHPYRKKIAITKDDKHTQLYVEVERFDVNAKKVVLHVSRDNFTIASGVDTELYLYYDPNAIDNVDYIGDIASSAGSRVWDSNFKAVYHMCQDPSNYNVLDSTNNSNNTTSHGNMTFSDLVESPINKAIDFDGDDDYLAANYSSSLNITDSITLETYIKIKEFSDFSGIFCVGCWEHYNPVYSSYALQQVLNGKHFRVTFNWSRPDQHTLICNTALQVDAWYYLVGVYDYSTKEVFQYINGIMDSNSPSTWNGPIDAMDSSHKLYIGVDPPGGVEYGNEVIDEIRISNVARSSGWIKATYYSITNQLVSWHDAERYFYDGYVYEMGVPKSRLVRLYDRQTGQLIDENYSDSITGKYYLETPISGAHFIVAFDDDAGYDYNALILDRVQPKGFL